MQGRTPKDKKPVMNTVQGDPPDLVPPRIFGWDARKLANYGTLLGIVAIGVMCGSLVLFATRRWGIALASDSLSYFNGAQSLAAGRGFYDGPLKITHYPPGYSSVLAAILSVADVQPAFAARVLNALLFSVTVISGGLLVWRYAGRIASLVAALLIVLHPNLWQVHLFAGSEPLAIAVGMGVLWCMLLYVERPRTWLAVLIGLAIMAGWLIRYAGVFWLPVGCLAVVLARPGLRRGVLDAAFLVAIALVPNLMWMYRCGAVRDMAWHPLSQWTVQTFLDTPKEWNLSAILGAVLIVALVMGYRALWKPVLLLVAAIVSYAALLLLTLLLFDATMPLNWRILSPAVPPVLLLMAIGLRAIPDVLRRFGRGRLGVQQIIVTALVLALLPWHTWYFRARRTVNRFAANGGGFVSRRYHESPTMAAVRKLPDHTEVWAYSAAAIKVVTGKERSRRMPWKLDPFAALPRPEYEQEMALLAESVANGGVAVWLNFDKNIWFMPTPDEITAHLGEHQVRHLEDGIIWGLAAREGPATRPTTLDAADGQSASPLPNPAPR